MAALAEPEEPPGGLSSPADFSTFLFPTFQREKNPCGAHKDGAVIKHAGFSEIIQHFDTFIVSCLIYGFQPQTEFMFL